MFFFFWRQKTRTARPAWDRSCCIVQVEQSDQALIIQTTCNEAACEIRGILQTLRKIIPRNRLEISDIYRLSDAEKIRAQRQLSGLEHLFTPLISGDRNVIITGEIPINSIVETLQGNGFNMIYPSGCIAKPHCG